MLAASRSEVMFLRGNVMNRSLQSVSASPCVELGGHEYRYNRRGVRRARNRGKSQTLRLGQPQAARRKETPPSAQPCEILGNWGST